MDVSVKMGPCCSRSVSLNKLISVIPRLLTFYRNLNDLERNPFALVASFEVLFIVSVQGIRIPLVNSSYFIEHEACAE